VRVVGMGEFSTELCGGTHVKRTGDIGLFKIVSEGGVAAGVRRIEAMTGPGAVDLVQDQDAVIGDLSARLKATPAELAGKFAQIQDQVKALEKELARFKSKMASSQGDDLADRAVEIAGAKILATAIEGADVKTLRELADKLRDKLKSCAVLLAATAEGKVSLIAAVTADLTDRIKAGELVNHVATQVGGKGGGRPDMAQAGGNQPENLSKALDSVTLWARTRLGGE
jgi:alanyl-tRNA synthetase